MISDTSPNARRYGVKLVVVTGATCMFSLMPEADLKAFSSDDLIDWPHA